MASTDSSLFAYASDDERRKEKAPNALRTISEASDLLEVPQHVLRFWETKFPQIKPLKRNGGRRFYRPQDLEVLQQIKHLLYSQGYTIKGAKKAIDDFTHDRSQENPAEWLAAIPPASVNDNIEPAAEEDPLAEIAEALNAPLPRVADAQEPLRRLRAELAAAHAELAMALRQAA